MLQVTLPRTTALALALASLTACDSEPLTPLAEPPARAASVIGTSGNSIDRDEATVPYSFVVYASCANGGQGEVLQVSGLLEYRGHWLTTTHGQLNHYLTVASFSGTGTGWDTGDVYDVVTRELAQGNTAWGTDGILDSGEQLERVRLLLTNRATGATIEIVLVGKFVQTPAGEYVIDGWNATTRCG